MLNTIMLNDKQRTHKTTIRMRLKLCNGAMVPSRILKLVVYLPYYVFKSFKIEVSNCVVTQT